MKKIYYLSTCNTCKRIMKELEPLDGFELQDLKKDPIAEKELDFLYRHTQSYEVLFNRRSQLYKQRDLKNQLLRESDYKKLILEHYSFLKRPVVVVNDGVFVGNAAKTVEAAKTAIAKL